MKILLDECVDRRFAGELPGHTVETVVSIGWAGTHNGELLRRAAEGGFEVFVTVDRNLALQQNLRGVPFSVVVLRAGSNRLLDLAPLAPDVLACLSELKPGEVRYIPEH